MTFSAVIERCKETGLYVAYIPGLPGAHSQGETLDELRLNMIEVIEMLMEDGIPEFESEFMDKLQTRITEIELNKDISSEEFEAEIEKW